MMSVKTITKRLVAAPPYVLSRWRWLRCSGCFTLRTNSTFDTVTPFIHSSPMAMDTHTPSLLGRRLLLTMALGTAVIVAPVRSLGAPAPTKNLAVQSVAVSATSVITGQWTTYTIAVKNTVNAPQSSSSFTITLPTGFSLPTSLNPACSGTVCSMGAFTALQTKTMTVTLLPGGTCGSMKNLTVTLPTDANSADNSKSVGVMHACPVINLGLLSLTASPATVSVGQRVTYAITIMNKGNIAVSSSPFTLSMPAGFSTWGSVGVTCSGNACSAGAFNAGNTKTVRITLIAGGACGTKSLSISLQQDANNTDNTGSVPVTVSGCTTPTSSVGFLPSSPPSSPSSTSTSRSSSSSSVSSSSIRSSSSSSTSSPSPSLSVTKTANPVVALPGGAVAYTIVVSNAATAGTAPAVKLTDTLPGGFTTTVAQVTGGGTCTVVNTGTTVVTCPNIGPLAPGASKTVTIIATIPSGNFCSPDPFGNTVTVSTNETTTTDDRTATADVAVRCPPDLMIEGGLPPLALGKGGLGKFTVRNIGLGSAALSQFEAVFPSGLRATDAYWRGLDAIPGETTPGACNIALDTPSIGLMTVSCSFGTLPMNKGVVVVVDMTSFSCAPSPASVQARASTTSLQSRTDNDALSLPTSVSCGTSADLSIATSCTDALIGGPGDLRSCYLRVSNLSSNTKVDSVVLSAGGGADLSPEAAVTDTGSPCTVNAGARSITCALGTFQPGTQRTVRVDARMAAAPSCGSIGRLPASVVGGGNDSNTANNSTQVQMFLACASQMTCGSTCNDALRRSVDGDGNGVITQIEKDAVIALARGYNDAAPASVAACCAVNPLACSLGDLRSCGLRSASAQRPSFFLARIWRGIARFSTFWISPTIAQSTTIADANADGIVNAIDLLLLERFLKSQPTCGDGFVAIGEQCDDGNALSIDGCSAMCTMEYDMNGDGLVTPVDAQIIISKLSNPPPQPDLRYDVNKDGIVSALDAQIVINYLTVQRDRSL